VTPHNDTHREPNDRGFIPGLIAGEKVPTKLVDRVANRTQPCLSLEPCDKTRTGKSKYCPEHKAQARRRFQHFLSTGNWDAD